MSRELDIPLKCQGHRDRLQIIVFGKQNVVSNFLWVDFKNKRNMLTISGQYIAHKI